MKPRDMLILISAFAIATALASYAEKPACLDPLAKSAAAAKEADYKGTKIVQTLQAGKSTQFRAKVYHRKPDKTRTEYIAPPSVAGMVVLYVGPDRWRYSPTTRQWARTTGGDEEENFVLARKNYRADFLGDGIVAGRQVRAFELVPRIPGNPSKTIWLDKQHNLVLRTEWRSSIGVVTSWSRFIEIEFNPPDMPNELFEPPRAPAHSAETPLERPTFKVVIPGYVPKGYVLAETTVLPIDGQRVVHLKFTNGLNTISLFEHVHGRTPDEPSDPTCSSNAFPFSQRVSWQHGGLAFTLMGDVRPSELQKIAESARK